MKVCPKCTVSREDFNRNRGRRDGLSVYCRPCTRGIDADFHKKRSAASIVKKGILRRAAIKKIRAAILEYRQTHPCVDCGENDPIVLDFDHRIRKDKQFSIANATSITVSIETLRAEMAKCDIRCANCHRRKTYKERYLLDVA